MPTVLRAIPRDGTTGSQLLARGSRWPTSGSQLLARGSSWPTSGSQRGSCRGSFEGGVREIGFPKRKTADARITQARGQLSSSSIPITF